MLCLPLQKKSLDTKILKYQFLQNSTYKKKAETGSCSFILFSFFPLPSSWTLHDFFFPSTFVSDGKFLIQHTGFVPIWKWKGNTFALRYTEGHLLKPRQSGKVHLPAARLVARGNCICPLSPNGSLQLSRSDLSNIATFDGARKKKERKNTLYLDARAVHPLCFVWRNPFTEAQTLWNGVRKVASQLPDILSTNSRDRGKSSGSKNLANTRWAPLPGKSKHKPEFGLAAAWGLECLFVSVSPCGFSGPAAVFMQDAGEQPKPSPLLQSQQARPSADIHEPSATDPAAQHGAAHGLLPAGCLGQTSPGAQQLSAQGNSTRVGSFMLV